MSIPAELMAVILQKTHERKLDWRQLSSASFTAPIGENSISIEKSPFGGYTLRIVNEQGTEIEKSDAAPFEATPMAEIYDLARRQALRVEESLRNIHRNLEKL